MHLVNLYDMIHCLCSLYHIIWYTVACLPGRFELQLWLLLCLFFFSPLWDAPLQLNSCPTSLVGLSAMVASDPLKIWDLVLMEKSTLLWTLPSLLRSQDTMLPSVSISQNQIHTPTFSSSVNFLYTNWCLVIQISSPSTISSMKIALSTSFWIFVLGRLISTITDERCDMSLIKENTNTKHIHKWSEAQWLSNVIHTN